MSDYQVRKDIDSLYFMVWDREANELKLVTNEEFDETLLKYYDRDECDVRFATKSEVDTSLSDYYDKDDCDTTFATKSELNSVTPSADDIYIESDVIDSILEAGGEPVGLVGLLEYLINRQS